MNLSNGGGDTAPEEPISDANPELKLDAALVNDPPLPNESAADAGDVNASDSDFPPLPNGLLSPAGICGGRKPPIAEPADGIPPPAEPPPTGNAVAGIPVAGTPISVPTGDAAGVGSAGRSMSVCVSPVSVARRSASSGLVAASPLSPDIAS